MDNLLSWLNVQWGECTTVTSLVSPSPARVTLNSRSNPATNWDNCSTVDLMGRIYANGTPMISTNTLINASWSVNLQFQHNVRLNIGNEIKIELYDMDGPRQGN